MAICFHCGKEIISKDSKKYCDQSCYREHKKKNHKSIKLDLKCIVCGEKIIRFPSQVKNKDGLVTCGAKCKRLASEKNSFVLDKFRFDYKNYSYFQKDDKPFQSKGIRPSKYEVNHNLYSDGIVDDKTAYLFGVLLTDGYVLSDNRYRVSLKMNDYDIVSQAKDIFESNHPIKMYQNNSYNLAIHSKKLVHDLSCLGCYQNKTESVNYPEIDDKLDKHFLRGVFDGDGSLSITERSYGKEIILKFHGHDKFLFGVYLKLKKHLGIVPLRIEYPIDHDDNYKMKNYSVLVYNKRSALLFGDWIYSEESWFGVRKYNKYQSIK